jgi:hypothetical protein
MFCRCDSYYEEIAHFKKLSVDTLSQCSDSSECKEESLGESWTYSRGAVTPYENVELGGRAAVDNIYSESPSGPPGTYENWTVLPPSDGQSHTTKSVIYEFDPLYREDYPLSPPPPPPRFDSLDSDQEDTLFIPQPGTTPYLFTLQPAFIIK